MEGGREDGKEEMIKGASIHSKLRTPNSELYDL
jgi:hypothetical protein